MEIRNEINRKWGNLSSYFDCHEQESITEYKWINEYWSQINYKYEMWNNYHFKIVIGQFKVTHGNEKLIFNSIFIYFSRLFRLLSDEKHF